ncbi:MAG: MFS transporter, partial [Mycobacteriaceae bacterium]|nr:MFS transporter [Mycobacteriaceae bacterium]
SQFGEGLFNAGLAGAILFNPERAATPSAIAASFAVLFLPYSLLGPFAGAMLDRWDRRLVLVGANAARLVLITGVGSLLALGAGDRPILAGALVVNGVSRFVTSGLSAALPHVVPREQVVTMNAVATAIGAAATFVGANFMLLPRWLFGANDTGSATVIFIVLAPVVLALLLALRFAAHRLGPDVTARSVRGSAIYAVATGWLHGLRTVIGAPSVTATLAGLAAHRIAFGVNTMLMLVIVRHTGAAVAGLGTAVVFLSTTAFGGFIATVLTPVLVRRIGRFAAANSALAAAAAIQLVGSGLVLPVMLVCGFLLGAAGQVVKLCADTAMQIDVVDPLRGHVFAVQDSLFWLSFVGATAVTAALIPADGRSPALALAAAGVYLTGLAAHAVIGRRIPAP